MEGQYYCTQVFAGRMLSSERHFISTLVALGRPSSSTDSTRLAFGDMLVKEQMLRKNKYTKNGIPEQNEKAST